MSYIHPPETSTSFPFKPPFALCVCFISVCGCLGERQPLHLYLYLLSIATTAAVKSNRPEVTVSVSFSTVFTLLPVFFVMISFYSYILLAHCRLITCPSWYIIRIHLIQTAILLNVHYLWYFWGFLYCNATEKLILNNKNYKRTTAGGRNKIKVSLKHIRAYTES